MSVVSEQTSHSPSLQIAEDFTFERRSWFWQRVGWCCIALMIAASLLGLFGTGLFGLANAGEKGSALWLEFNRFGGKQAETSTLRLHLGANAVPDGRARIWFNRDYAQAVEMRFISPEPEAVAASGERIVYTFRIEDPGAPTTINFNVEPQEVGALRGQLGLESGAALHFDQFIYP